MTADEYADTAAEQLYADGTPTASRIRDALAAAYLAGRADAHRRARQRRQAEDRRAAKWFDEKFTDGVALPAMTLDEYIEGDRGLTAWNADE